MIFHSILLCRFQCQINEEQLQIKCFECNRSDNYGYVKMFRVREGPFWSFEFLKKRFYELVRRIFLVFLRKFRKAIWSNPVWLPLGLSKRAWHVEEALVTRVEHRRNKRRFTTTIHLTPDSSYTSRRWLPRLTANRQFPAPHSLYPSFLIPFSICSPVCPETLLAKDRDIWGDLQGIFVVQSTEGKPLHSQYGNLGCTKVFMARYGERFSSSQRIQGNFYIWFFSSKLAQRI